MTDQTQSDITTNSKLSAAEIAANEEAFLKEMLELEEHEAAAKVVVNQVAVLPSTIETVTPDTPVVANVPEVVDAIVQTTDVSIKLDDLNPQVVSIAGKISLAQIQEYVVNMRPKRPMLESEGARHQVILYRTLINIINNIDEDFVTVFSTILRLFEEHRDDVFHEMYVFRFMEHITLSDIERKAFHRLLNLLRISAPIKGRDLALKQVDFNSTLQYGITEIGKQRIYAFFGR